MTMVSPLSSICWRIEVKAWLEIFSDAHADHAASDRRKNASNNGLVKVVIMLFQREKLMVTIDKCMSGLKMWYQGIRN